MTTLLLRRLFELIPTLIGVSLLTFLFIRMTPGDPAKLMLGPEATEEAIANMRVELGMAYKDTDGTIRPMPLASQYVHYLWGIARGNLGTSITTKLPVWDEIMARLPATLELGLLAMFFATVGGMVVGVLSAAYPKTLLDNGSRLLVFIFLAMPPFWLGLELIILLSRNLEWFPPAGRSTGGIVDRLMHLVLPAMTLGLGTAALLCRVLRSSMVQVLSMDYIRTARAKGLDGWTVTMKHALMNALIPFITVAGLSSGSLLGGSVIVETVFNWPGVGKLLVDSIGERNFPVTMGAVLVLAVIFVLVNLVVDLLYEVIDPRIRTSGGK